MPCSSSPMSTPTKKFTPSSSKVRKRKRGREESTPDISQFHRKFVSNSCNYDLLSLCFLCRNSLVWLKLVFSAWCIRRANCRTIAMMSVCSSVCLSVRPSICLGQAFIVIIQCTLARIWVYGWIVQCSGHPDTKACPPTPNRLFPILPGREVGYGCGSEAKL